MPTPQQLAQQMSDAFEKRTRDDGSTFYALKDDRPEWMTEDVVFPAHGDMLPEDWRYRFIYEAVTAIADADEDATEDDLREIGYEIEPDVYTHDRLAWLASHLNRPAYCDQATEEGFYTYEPDGSGIVGLIGAGQYLERREVFESVLQSLIDHAEQAEDAA